MASQDLKTNRTKLGRIPSRGSHDRAVINEILDSGYLCHVGVVDDGLPVVIPTAYGREGDWLYLHGSVKSRLLMLLAEGADCCITVTHLDALVLARSVFHHSMNYRSVVVFGKGELVTEENAKMHALEVITDNILAGRWTESRLPNAGEMKATTVVRIPITEASAKVRTGPPGDDRKDMELDIWAGLLPVREERLAPIPSPDLKEGLEELPGSVKGWMAGE